MRRLHAMELPVAGVQSNRDQINSGSGEVRSHFNVKDEQSEMLQAAMEYASEAASKERLPKSPIKIADNRGQTLARYIHKKRGAIPAV